MIHISNGIPSVGSSRTAPHPKLSRTEAKLQDREARPGHPSRARRWGLWFSSPDPSSDKGDLTLKTNRYRLQEFKSQKVFCEQEVLLQISFKETASPRVQQGFAYKNSSNTSFPRRPVCQGPSGKSQEE